MLRESHPALANTKKGIFMKETNLARQVAPETTVVEQAATQPAEIRLLDDLELVLAGGGDTTTTWP